MSVPALPPSEGKWYQFRVVAVNKAGESWPSFETKPHLCRHKNCKYRESTPTSLGHSLTLCVLCSSGANYRQGSWRLQIRQGEQADLLENQCQGKWIDWLPILFVYLFCLFISCLVYVYLFPALILPFSTSCLPALNPTLVLPSVLVVAPFLFLPLSPLFCLPL